MKILLVIIIGITLLGCGKKKDTALEGVKILKSDSIQAEGMDQFKLENYIATNQHDTAAVYQFKLENYIATDQPDTTSVYTINFNCAVFVYPTKKQIEEMKKEMGEDNFFAVADDSNFYQSQAIQLIDSAGVKTTGTEKQFIKFMGNGKSWILDVRKKDLPAWNLILFQKNKPPQPYATISLTYDSVKNYFE